MCAINQKTFEEKVGNCGFKSVLPNDLTIANHSQSQGFASESTLRNHCRKCHQTIFEDRKSSTLSAVKEQEVKRG